MYITEDYLLEEATRIPGHPNAPTFTYYTYYGKEPTPRMGGRDVSHKTRKVNGIDLDVGIPKKSFLEISKIKGIETRSSCQGEDNRHLTFIVFRPLNRDEKTSIEICNNLNKFKDIRAAYNLGSNNLFRICVTWKTWYGQKGFDKWWKELPSKIKKSL